VPVVVALNSYLTDTDAEVQYVKDFCESRDCDFDISQVWEHGGAGGEELAKAVINTLENKTSNYASIYTDDMSPEEKIEAISKKIYGADGVVYAPAAKKQLKKIVDMGYGKLPVCMAKTQYSLSDDPALLGRPTNFDINVRDVYVSAGAGFIVALTGNIMTMPGLPKKPAAFGIDVDDNGNITGLF
jgi:formate--tetrahydrofolate ligase